MRTALTIAGSDSSGGAGIQADIKTMICNGVYAMSAITALTAQNTVGVTGIMEVTPEFLGEQLDNIFTDIYPDAVKIGMVSNSALIVKIAEKLKEYKAKNIVVDPVMTLLNDVTNSERIGFVSCDNYAMGEMYGSQICEAAKSLLEKEAEINKIKVTLLVNSREENTSINVVHSGIRKELGVLEGKVVLSEVFTDDDSFDSEETVYELILGNDIPDIIVCFGTADTVSVYRSVVEYNKAGEVTIIGYYFSEDILDGIEKGIIKSTISIDTEQMGETAVEALYQYLEKDYVSEYLPVSAELITADSAAQYRRKEK